MSEYYGVLPSSDFFAHYGVKGMKWGVRRALSRGARGEKALARQYKKAQKKLDKLNARADIATQSKRAKRYGAIAGVGGAIGAVGAGGVIPATKKLSGLNSKYTQLGKDYSKFNKLRSDNVVSQAQHVIGAMQKGRPYEHLIQGHQAMDKFYKGKMDSAIRGRLDLGDSIKKARNTQLGAAAVGLTGLTIGGIAGGKAIAAKYRTTKKGHAKAAAKRNAWQNEMAKVFSGTKYGNKKRR